jgi:uncharacterized protein (TIGR04255 family)
VLCEIRFAPVLTMGTHVPDIQERLRQADYAGFEEAVEHQFEFGPAAGPKLVTQNRWLFKRADGTKTVTLSTSAVSLQVTQYSQFEDFVEALEPIVEMLSTLVAPAYHERIGLRYVNSVENAGARMTELFREAILSFTSDDLGVDTLLTAQQLVGRTARGQIIVRMNQVENGPLVPPDLLLPGFPDLARPREGVHAILDIDGADTTPGVFSFAAMEERLWDIHAYTERAFWRSTTDVAHKEWGLITENGEVDD